jgi:hypothetical protein
MVEARYVLQNAATTGNGTAKDLKGNGREHTFYLEPSGTVSGGTVTLETARAEDYSGTWAVIAGPITMATGVTQVVHHTAALLAVRARISSNITGGGNVTVELVSN